MEFATLIFFFIIIIPSAIIHEYMHGWVANYFGDPTAKYAGRLTLNPLAHIDLFGTIILPTLMFFTSGFFFAYAKPVPVNPLFLRGKYAGMLVAAAGPLSNFFTAGILGLIARLIPLGFGMKVATVSHVLSFQWGQIFSAGSPLATFYGIVIAFIFAHILLGVFNLIPVPPLDGSKVLFPLLPASWDNFKYNLERYGIWILLFLIFFVGVGRLIYPIILYLFKIFVGIF